MKYIKTYENIKNNKFWLINIKDEIYFLASLKHINCNKEDHTYFQRIRNLTLEKYIESNQLYINKENENRDHGYTFVNEFSYNWYIEHKFEFMGEIIPTPEEINEIEIKINVKRYNL